MEIIKLFKPLLILTLLTLFPLAAACVSAPPPAEVALKLRLTQGQLFPERVEARQDDTVTLQIESDQAGAIHLHGYDLTQDLTPGTVSELTFTANATGQYRIAFHPAGAGSHEADASGSSGSTNPSPSSAGHGSAGHGSAGHGSAGHGSVEASGPLAISLSATITPATVGEEAGGVNLEIRTENWRWAPEEVNQAPSPGAGHAHIYVDGVKQTRIYGPQHYLPNLAPGQREVSAQLNDNQHNILTWQGEPLEDSLTLTIPDFATGGQAAPAGTATSAPVEAPGPMALELTAHPDALGGYNLQADATGFTFAEQGYGQLSIDGATVTRIYTPWFQLPPLDPGNHAISVALFNHRGQPYHSQGEPVAAELALQASEPAAPSKMVLTAANKDQPTNHDHDHDGAGTESADQELELGFLVVQPR